MSSKEISCKKCNGACCHDIKMPLNNREGDFMRKGGTQLEQVFSDSPAEDVENILRGILDSTVPITIWDALAARSLQEGEKIYFIKGACGYLVVKDGWPQCSVYENPDRPRACRAFEMGSGQCASLFESRAGVEVKLTQKPQKQ